MNICATMKVGTLFKLIFHKSNPEKPTKQTDWFHNLVLNAGLDRLSVGRADSQLNIGSGNSTPAITQTNLDSFMAASTTVQTQASGRNFDNPSQPYYWIRRTYRFNAGVGTGTIAELGLGWSNTNCFNRTLVKDSGGNPTTITKLSDEYLDVLTETRVYPQPNISGSFNLLDKTNTLVSSHTYTGKVLLNQDPNATGQIGQVGFSYATGAFFIADLNIVDDYTTAVAGSVISGATGITEYPTARSCKGTVTLPIGIATGIHKAFQFRFTNLVLAGPSSQVIGYKWQISPTINKLSTWEMQYSFTITWDRYTP